MRFAAVGLFFGIIIGWFILALSAAGLIYDYKDSISFEHLPQVDVIVCLSGGRGRIRAASELWSAYQRKVSPAPILYISGMGRQANWSVVQAQVDPAVLEKLKPENVVMETTSTNTEENARWFLDHAEKAGWRHIVLVTSSYHMRRSQLIFERTLNPRGDRYKIETYSVVQEPFQAGKWDSSPQGINVTVSEFMKWIYYRAFMDARK
jgi:uncharacterized SAM-binding protein YcdF (DUF218 family)